MNDQFEIALISSHIVLLESVGKLVEADKLREVLSLTIAKKQHEHSLRMFGQRAPEDKKSLDTIRDQIDNAERSISVSKIQFMALSPFGMINGDSSEDLIESASRNMQLLLKQK